MSAGSQFFTVAGYGAQAQGVFSLGAVFERPWTAGVIGQVTTNTSNGRAARVRSSVEPMRVGAILPLLAGTPRFDEH